MLPVRLKWIITALSVLVAAVLVGHRAIPDTSLHLGSLVETFLPWLGLTVPVLLALVCWRRSAVAAASVLLPLAAWLALFGGYLLPRPDGGHQLIAVQHNVSDENPDPAGTVRTLTAVRPDLVSLVELTPATLPTYAAELARDYPHHIAAGTVGLWSKHPLTEDRPVDIRPNGVDPDWSRGLLAVAHTPHGEVAVLVAHLPSIRLNRSGLDCVRRDDSAVQLGEAIDGEPTPRLLLMGDLNGTVDDRALRPVTSRMTTDRRDLAFSFPAGIPVARIDHVFGRSVRITGVWTLPKTGSDHLAVAATVRL